MPQLTLAFSRPNYHTVKLHSLPLSMPYQITPVHKLPQRQLTGEFSPQVLQPPGSAPTPHPSSSSSAAAEASCKADSRSGIALKGYNRRSRIETMIGRWDTNGNERISCADPRERRDISGDRAKNPASDCAVPPFRDPDPMAESAEGSCAVIVSESACRPRRRHGRPRKKATGFNPPPEDAALSWLRYRQPPGPPRRCARK